VREREGIREALPWYRAAWRQEKTLHENNCELADVLQNLDRYKESLRYAIKAHETEPEEDAAIALLFRASVKAGEIDRVRALAPGLHAINWENLGYMTSVATSLYIADLDDEAAYWVERARAINPDHISAICLSARIHMFTLEKPKKALTLFRRLMKLDPANHGASSALYIARIQGDMTGDWPGALRTMISARLSWPENKDIQGYLEYVADRLAGKVAEAAVEQERWKQRFDALNNEHTTLKQAIIELRTTTDRGTPLGIALVDGESSEVEFIEEFPGNTRELAKEIAAFSTSGEGVIYLGVNDSCEVCGLTGADSSESKDALIQRLSGITSGVIKPPVDVQAHFISQGDKIVLRILVPKGPHPVYYVGNTPYLRHLDKSRPAEFDEVQRLILAAGLR
jgi:hypothetical protein